MLNSFIKRTVLVTLLFVVIFSISAQAVEKIGMSRTKLYFGLNLPYNSIGGDFVGEIGLSNSQTVEIIMVPKIESGIGFGGLIGYAKTGQSNFGFAAELSYQRSSHDYIWGQFSGKASFTVVNADIKISYMAKPVEPYAVIGLTVPRLNINGGAGLREGGTSYIYYNRTDAKYTGLGVSIGAGLDLYLTPNISFGGRVVYRSIKYNFITGDGDKFEIGGGMSGSGINVCGSLNYHLPLK